MLYYLTAAGLMAHAFFWGLGLAWLALPREWRRWGWAFAPGFGWALLQPTMAVEASTPAARAEVARTAFEITPAHPLMLTFTPRADGPSVHRPATRRSDQNPAVGRRSHVKLPVSYIHRVNHVTSRADRIP